VHKKESNLRNYILALALLSSPAFSQALDEPMDTVPAPDSAQEIYDYQTRKFAQLLDELNTHEYFAGTLTSLQFRGQSYAVDRRQEKMKRTPGNPPPRLETLGSLLGGLSASTRGQIKINVDRQYYENGTLKSETWTIEAGGSWETSTGMDDAMGKQHK
jgi:hypothetical protein